MQSINDAFASIVSSDELSDPFGVLFSHVTNIDFSESSSGLGTIVFGQAKKDVFLDDSLQVDQAIGAVALAYNEAVMSNDTHRAHGDIWINTEQYSQNFSLNLWENDAEDTAGNSVTIDKGTWSYKALMEETMHSLGVDLLPLSSGYPLDSHKFTVTSYEFHDDMFRNTIDGTGPFPLGLQLYDIFALQRIYGRNYSTRHTDNIGGNAYKLGNGFASSKDTAFSYTIWDGGGEDELSALGYDHAAQIDLRQGRFSSIGTNGDPNGDPRVLWDTSSYDAGNLTIAFHTIIENARGTDVTNDTHPGSVDRYGDVIIGNAWDNKLYGEDGNDALYGDGVIYGQITTPSDLTDDDPGFHEANTVPDASGTVHAWGPDNVSPADNDSGDDELYGGAGDDWLFGGLGNNTLHGGEGFEIIEYNYVFDDSEFDILVAENTKANGDYDVTRTIDDGNGGTITETDTLQRIERVAHAEKRIENTVGNDARGLNIAEIDLGYVAVFILDQANGLTFGVHYQLYDFNGDAIGNTERVSQVDPYRKKEYNPDVTTTANGFIVVWDSGEKRHAGKKTLARAFDVDAQGNVTEQNQETVFVNEVDTNGNTILGWKTADYDQTVDTLTNGKAVVVAEVQGNLTDNPGIAIDRTDIIVNIIDGSTAAPMGTKAVVNTDQADFQTDPSVTALTSGEFVATWTSSDGDSTGIFFQRMSENGGAVAKEGSETRVNVNTTGGQLSSSIDGLANGGFVVTWVDGSSNGSDIFFRLYNNSGVAQTSEILVNDSLSGSQHLPTVSALEDGGFVISFTESSASGDGQGSSVFAQQYDASGAKKGDNFLVNVSHEGGQSNSTVEALDNGDFVVGWYDASHDLLNRVYSVSDSELVA